MGWVNRSILNKLLAISAIGFSLLLSGAFYGFWVSWQSIHTFETEVSSHSEEAFSILEAQTDFKVQVQEWKNTLLRGSDPASLEKYWGGFEKHERKVQKNIQNLLKRVNDPKARKLLEDFQAAHQKMGEGYRQGLQAFKDSSFDSKAGDHSVKGMDRAPTELLTQAAEAISALADNTSKQAVANGYGGIKTSIFLMILATLLAAVVLVWMIRTSVIHPARQTVEGLERLATGDFSMPIQHTSHDEIGRISACAERIRGELRNIIAGISTASDELLSSSTSMAAATSQVRESSQAQSEKSSATAAAVEEMASSIASVTESTESMRQLANSSQEQAHEGNASISKLAGEVGQVENAVKEIAASVGQFVQSTTTITNMTRQVKDIADQTNLLALNAAIEAARAGEQGRGFAVVADEVRKLAEKSGQAASEIDAVTQSIGQYSVNVDKAIHQGMNSIEASQEMMKTVALILTGTTETVTRVNQGMGNIALSAREQRSASDEIAKHVENIAYMAEENSMAAQQTDEEALRLKNVADQLRQSISQFKV
ncbi:MAG: methyl-accepting chemotaxis protein [Sulfuricella sp.]